MTLHGTYFRAMKGEHEKYLCCCSQASVSFGSRDGGHDARFVQDGDGRWIDDESADVCSGMPGRRDIQPSPVSPHEGRVLVRR